MSTSDKARLDAAHTIANHIRIHERLHDGGRKWDDTIEHAINLYESSIVQMWGNGDSSDGVFQETCSRCCDLLRALPLPDDPEEKTKHVLKLFAYSYIGERWADMRRVIQKEDVWTVPEGDTWDRRVIYVTYRAILYLIKKTEWGDLDKSSKLVGQLRKEQKTREHTRMQDTDNRRYLARDLAAYYHLARTVDILARFMRDGGSPSYTRTSVDHHMDAARRLADGAWELETLLIILKAAFTKMIDNSIWAVAGTINSRTINLLRNITGRDSQKPVYELSYPQRTAIRQHLLDPAINATVLAISGGKTLLAEFRILQALNQFQDIGGKVIYVAPTRALVNQVTSRLRRELGPLGVSVEKMSGAIDISTFEENVLRDDKFDVLVTTPEKMNLMIRHPGGILTGDIVLTIIDGAHNISDENRGLNLEMLVSNIRNDCPASRLLLMTPFIPNHREVAKWLNPDNPHSISVNKSWWRPNDRVVGLCYADGPKGNRALHFKPLATHGPDMQTDKSIFLGSADIPISQMTKNHMVSWAASTMADRTVLILAPTIDCTFDIAEALYGMIPDETPSGNLDMVSRYVEVELGKDFALAKYIRRGVGIHNAGLPDDIRELVEWLMESGALKAVVSTTTLAREANFPADTVLFSKYVDSGDMPPMDFWNIAGRAGRVDQRSVGLVVIMAPKKASQKKVAEYVKRQTEDLASRLKELVEDAIAKGTPLSLLSNAADPKWSSFLRYVSHLYRQAGGLQNFINTAQYGLEGTYGYRQLSTNHKNRLLKAVKEYAVELDKGNKDMVQLSDTTGLNVQSMEKALDMAGELRSGDARWGDRLLSGDSRTLGRLLDMVFQEIPETKQEIPGIKSSAPITGDTMGRLVAEWMRGASLRDIAKDVLGADDSKSISRCVRIIYSKVANSASWGLSAMLKVPPGGAPHMTEPGRHVANLPAKVYYGVDTDAGVLMRLNSVPRSIAKTMGHSYESEHHAVQESTPAQVREWIAGLDDSRWEKVAGSSSLTGAEYKKIWERLSGR